MKPPLHVDDDQKLAKLAARLARQPAIGIDTESNPLFAYHDRICLVQISTSSQDFLVDVLAGVDLGLLSPVLADPSVTKVFHDAEFDLLMLKRLRPFEIAGLFDTKVAATALGLPRVGLASLLRELFGVELDKKLQRSDWGRRPLTEAQVEYAVCDTHYLLPMADELRRRLHDAGEPAVLELASECRRLCALEPAPQPFDPDDWVRIKGADTLDERGRRALRELFVMRHELASERDTPAFKVLGNEVLLALARLRPRDRAALRRVRAVSPKLARRHADDILATLVRAEKAGPVPAPRRRIAEADELSAREREAYDALRAWRKKTAEARPTDASLVLPRAAMLALARMRRKPRDTDDLLAAGVLEPWRVRHYGEQLVAVLAPFRS